MTSKTEKEVWQETAGMFGDYKYDFGEHWSYNFRNDPKRLAFVLSRYKFAAKMIGKANSVLEMGCSDGIGASILAENAQKYLGIDLDAPAIEAARYNFGKTKHEFHTDDFMGKVYGQFDGVVSLDVVEHILAIHENEYFDTLHKNLTAHGVCVVGTPNITSDCYASLGSKMGHVNLFSQERLQETLGKYFAHVFPFGMNDEVVHTGFAPMSHYLICVCCGPIAKK